ncbi:MAG: WYL domain-containing protein [Actinomycetota bacterium]|nr:WYL domain-containing protein [Actinomycetota bacterium]
MQKVIERILNLLAFLLTVDRPVTADEIRMTVAGYDRGNDEAFRRTFERDKDLLRRLGVRLELRPTDAWEVEHGYSVRPASDFPDPGLTDDERAALWIAAQVVRMGGRSSGPDAMFKLGGTPLVPAGEPLAADLGTSEEDLAEVFVAVSERRHLAFAYRGRDRVVAPYGLAHRRGHWYLIGPERDDSRIKVFRLDRAAPVRATGPAAGFARPDGFSAASFIPEAPWEAGDATETVAVVRIDPDLAWWAERQLHDRNTVTRLADGGIEASLRVVNPDALIGWVLSFEDGAEIVGPPGLRQRFIERVTA